MTTVVYTNLLQPKPGQRNEAVEVLKEMSALMHAQPGTIHYSVSRPIDDEDGPLTVVQVYSSPEAAKESGALTQDLRPKLFEALTAPPQPPVPYEQIALNGNPEESF